MNKILLIDGNSILNRGFYGLPDLTNSKGLHTNAVLGFLNIMLKVIDEENPSNICVAFDLKEPTFRHKKFNEYKGNRKPMPDELREQVPVIKDVLHAMNIKTLEKAGYEADDIIGTLSVMSSQSGYDVTVLSGDRDLLQLARENVIIRIPKTKAGGTVMENYSAEDVKLRYGVTPEEFIEMKGLMGDTSDNIPGVPGIGEKTAAKIIMEYGSIDNALSHIDEIKPNKARENLSEYREQAVLSRELSEIKLDCDLDIKIEDTKVSYDSMFNQNSLEVFSELEFKSIINKHDFNGAGIREDSISYKIVDDYEEYLKLIESIKKYSECGISPVVSNGRLIACAFCIGEDVFVAEIINFITENMIRDDIRNIIDSGTLLSFISFKDYIGVLGLFEKDSLFDCSVAAYLLNPLKPHYDYSDIAGDFLNLKLPDLKELGLDKMPDSFDMTDESIQKKTSYEAYTAYNAYKPLYEKLKEYDMLSLYSDIENPSVFALYDMEKHGIKVDKAALKEYGDNLKNRIDELTGNIYEYAGETFNINSTKQLGVILFEKLGLKAGKKTKSGYSTSVDVLEKIKDEHPIVPAILEYRQLTKLNSTYVEGLSAYIGEDGRIHGKFHQTVTATGRISSTEPNLQNIPMRTALGREIRKVFIPEEGYMFVDADYSQIELRVLAHLSNDETLIEAYKKSYDIHAITASEVFGVPLDSVDSLMRRRAKAVNFGIVYGISSFGLGQDLDISRKDAQKYIDKYFETYKDVKTFLDRQVEDAKRDGYVKTLYNRIRPIPELKSSNYMTRSFGERVAMNSPIQGTAADIIKLAMVHINMELKKRNLKSRLILQIHDELLIEAHETEIEEVKEIMTDKMTNVCSLRVPLYIDIHSGKNWFEAK